MADGEVCNEGAKLTGCNLKEGLDGGANIVVDFQYVSTSPPT